MNNLKNEKMQNWKERKKIMLYHHFNQLPCTFVWLYANTFQT